MKRNIRDLVKENADIVKAKIDSHKRIDDLIEKAFEKLNLSNWVVFSHTNSDYNQVKDIVYFINKRDNSYSSFVKFTIEDGVNNRLTGIITNWNFSNLDKIETQDVIDMLVAKLDKGE